MSANPTNALHDSTLPPLRRRSRERAAGRFFEGVTRVAGLRPVLLPEHLRRQLRILGASDEQVARVLPKVRSLGDWPYAWEDEGDFCAASGDTWGAFVAWYVAQRLLIVPTPLKKRLYRLAVDAYAHIDQAPLERLAITTPAGETVAAYLQLPPHASPSSPVPCILMVPGVSGTKEELHPYAMPLLRRGFAVARLDNPVYGETTGLLDHGSVRNPRAVLDHLATDPRIDVSRLHMHGMSLGAYFTLLSAAGSCAASVTVICPPYRPGGYVANLPTLNLTALQQMTRFERIEEILQFARELDVERVASELTMPMRIFHGVRDRTIPVRDGIALAAAVAGPTALTLYERDHHNCLEHTDEITALTLEFVRDPFGTCARMASVQHVHSPGSLHVSDHDAALASAGIAPSRRRARLPFSLPRTRARPNAAPG